MLGRRTWIAKTCVALICAFFACFFAPSYSFSAIPGDLDHDCDVDAADYTVFKATLGKCSSQTGYNAEANYDSDSCVSLTDYQKWSLLYKQFLYSDADKDGVANSLDLCPGTAACSAVDLKGCPSAGPVNNPPVLTSISGKTVAEGVMLSFLVSARDPDGNSVTLSSGALPAGSTFNTATGDFSWRPGFDQAGSYSVTFTASDGQASVSTAVNITVTNSNNAPVFSAIGEQGVSEGASLSFIVSATDLDGDVLTYEATGLPSGAAFDSTTRVFSWTPGFDQAGSYSVSFTASDGQASVSTAANIAVSDLNHWPSVLTGFLTSAMVDQTYIFDISASDPDGDALIYSVSGPAGMTITAAGRLIWNPSISDLGDNAVMVTVNDGKGGSDSRSYVVNVPDFIPPSLTVNAPLEAIPGASFNVLAEVSDNKGISSVIIEASGLPPAEIRVAPFSMDITLPSILSVGSSFEVIVSAQDISGNISRVTKSIKIVAAPDIVPPAVTLKAPASVVPGGTVCLSGSATDAGGGVTAAFYAGADLIGEGSGQNAFVRYNVPADAIPGSSIIFSLVGRDFSGNIASAEANVTVSDTPSGGGPIFDLNAPVSVKYGSTLPVSISAADPSSISGITLFLNHTLAARYASVPAEAVRISLPGALASGMDAIVEAVATDFFCNTSSKSLTVAIEAVRQGLLVGEVYDDLTSLPIAGAEASFIRAGAAIVSVVTDERGRYSIAADEGQGSVLISMAGYTSVERAGVSIGALAAKEVFDARLTPVSSAHTNVSSVLGGAASVRFGHVEAGLKAVVTPTYAGEALFYVPAGALDVDTAITLTQISGQGLAGLLPIGWSPLGAIDIAPAGVALRAASSLSIPNLLGISAASGAVLAMWDSSEGAWRAIADAAVASDGAVLTGAGIEATGQYAFIVPDALPASPPRPAAGGLIGSAASQPLPSDASAVIGPDPKVAFYKPGFRSDVGLTVSSTSPVQSGSVVAVRINEDYNFYSGSSLSTGSRTAELVAYNYNLPGASLGFTVAPSHAFEAGLLEKGIITLNAIERTGIGSLPLIGPEGGSILMATGEYISFPAGAFTDMTAVEFSALKASAAGAYVPAGFAFAGGFSIGFNGSLMLPASISVPAPAAPGVPRYLLVRAEDLEGATRLVLSGGAGLSGTDIVSSADLLGDGTVMLEGVLRAGRYFILEPLSPTGFAGGVITGVAGGAHSGALVTSDSVPGIVSLSNGGGVYASAIAAGPFTLTALDMIKKDSATASGLVSSANEYVRKDIALLAEPPRVVSVAPADGTLNVPLEGAVKISFSEPIDPSTATASNMSLIGPAGAVAASLSLSQNNTLVTIRPVEPFTVNSAYTVTVSDGVNDLAGYRMSAAFESGFTSLDTVPPAPPAAGSISAAIPGTDGRTTVNATQGTAGLHDSVWIENRTKATSTPALVEPNGSFSASIEAAFTDQLYVRIVDPAGNETVAEVPGFRQVNPDGSLSTVVGAQGGRITHSSGVAVDVPEGSFPEGAVVTINPVAEADFNIQLTDEQKTMFTYSGGVSLDFGGKIPAKYLNVSVPANGEQPVDPHPVYGYAGGNQKQWLLIQAVEVDGVRQPSMIDTARIIDGQITTSSPPCPGVTAAGVYGFLKTSDAYTVAYGDIMPAMRAVALTTFVEVTALFKPGMPLMNILWTSYNLPWGLIGDAVGAAAPRRVCLPVLSGRVNVIPNTVSIQIDRGSVGVDDLQFKIKNSSRAIESVYQKNLLETQYLSGNSYIVTVEGAPADKYDVDVTDSLGVTRSNACVAPGTSVLPFCTVTPAVTAGGSPSYNLLVRALPGTIDPTRPEIDDYNAAHPDSPLPENGITGVVVLNETTGSITPVPLSALVNGGFTYAVEGKTTDKFALEVTYENGSTEKVGMPTFRISVKNTSTGILLKDLTGAVPPRGAALKIGNIGLSAAGTLLLTTPHIVNDLDPGAPFSITFSKPIDKNTVTSGFVVLDSSGKKVAGKFEFSEDAKSVTFVPYSPLQMGEKYKLTLSGIADQDGSLLPFTGIELNTVQPRKIGSINLPDPVDDISIMRRDAPGGIRTIVAAINNTLTGKNKFFLVDVSSPTAPVLDGGYPIVTQLPRNLALLQGVSFDLRRSLLPTEPVCHLAPGDARFTGDLALTVDFRATADFGQISRLSLYDLADTASPCFMTGRFLTIDPVAGNLPAWQGAFRLVGYPGGLATLRHDTGYAAYVAVREVGMIALDIGANIPGYAFNEQRPLPGLYSGDYADVSIIGAPVGMPTSTELKSIEVLPLNATVKAGATQQFKAIGTYGDWTQKELTSVTWSSADAAIATVGSSGLATGVSAGTANITASMSGKTGSASIKVTEPLTANDDAAETLKDTLVSIDVLANDVDSDGAPVSPASVQVTISNTPSNGVATAAAGGAVTYEPAAGFSGTDSFTYTIKDSSGIISNSAKATIVVNAPPVAADDLLMTPKDTPATVNMLSNDNDPEGDTLAAADVTFATSPANGTIAIDPSSGKHVYTPNPGFSGTDLFTYTVKDAKGAASNTAMVTIRVNTPPVAGNDLAYLPALTMTDYAMAPNTADDACPAPVGAIECGCSKTGRYAAPLKGKGLNVVSTSKAAGTSPHGKYEVSAVLIGLSAEFTVKEASSGAVLLVRTVPAKSVAWGFSPDDDKFVYHYVDGFVHYIYLYDLNSRPARLIKSFARIMSSATVQFSPHGEYMFLSRLYAGSQVELTVIDAVSGSLAHNAEFTFVSPPGSKGDKYGVVTWGFSPDTADRTFVYAYVTGPSSVQWRVVNLDRNLSVGTPLASVYDETITAGAGFWQFSPCADMAGIVTQNGVSQMKVRLIRTLDGGLVASPYGDFPLKSVGLRTTPDAHLASVVDTAAVNIAVLANDYDPDMDALVPASVAVANEPSDGTATVNSSTGDIMFVPGMEFSGTVIFTYTVEDTVGDASNEASVVIKGNAVPVAIDDSATTAVDTPVSIYVAVNDTDPDGDPLDLSSITVESGPADAAVSVDSVTGKIDFMPNPGFTGASSFTYTVKDSFGAISNAATVTVDVTP